MSKGIPGHSLRWSSFDGRAFIICRCNNWKRWGYFSVRTGQLAFEEHKAQLRGDAACPTCRRPYRLETIDVEEMLKI